MRITLSQEEYWQLRALLGDVQVITREAQTIAAKQFHAENAARAFLDELGQTHGFDASRRMFTLHNAETRELSATEPGEGLN